MTCIIVRMAPALLIRNGIKWLSSLCAVKLRSSVKYLKIELFFSRIMWMTQYIYLFKSYPSKPRSCTRRELDCPLKWVGIRHQSCRLHWLICHRKSTNEHVNYPPWCMESTEPAKMFFFFCSALIYSLTLICRSTLTKFRVHICRSTGQRSSVTHQPEIFLLPIIFN